MKTSDGTLRESGKIYRAFVQGEISAGEAEIRSRILRRHSEILTSVEQRNQLAELQQQLAALNGEPASVPRLANDVRGEALP